MPRSTLDEFCFVWNNQTLYPNDRNRSSPAACHLDTALYRNEILTFAGDHNIYACSSEMELFKIILNNLRCSIKFVDSKVNFGGFKVNGTWTGILALFAQKKIDFIGHTFSYTAERKELINYDFLIPDGKFLSILSKPKSVHLNNPSKMFTTFSPIVLVFMLISFVVCTCLHHLNNTKVPKTATCLDKLYHLACAGFDVFGLNLGAGTVVLRSRQNILFNPIYVYIFGILVLRQLFSGELTAVLLSNQKYFYDYFEQLEQTDVKFLLERKSTSHCLFYKNYPHLAPRVTLLSFENVTSVATLTKLVEANYVMLLDRNYGKMVIQAWPHLGLHGSIESYQSIYYNYPIRGTLGGRRRTILTKLFRWIYYFGLSDRVQKKLQLNQFRLDHHHHPHLGVHELIALRGGQSTRQEIAITGQGRGNNLLAAVYIYTLGLLLAAVLLLAELVVSRLPTLHCDNIANVIEIY